MDEEKAQTITEGINLVGNFIYIFIWKVTVCS